MLRLASVCLVVLTIFFSCAEIKKTHKAINRPGAIPRMHITNDTTAVALKISVLDIKTAIAANVATTTFDIRFYNPNDKILEGELEFPLADGQHISGYAIDINGSLREGVVVEKTKARVAFESTVRKGIDPGLVEKTKGNNFRTRIYPLPAKGYRRVVITVEETLEQEDNDLLYNLPLVYEKQIIDSLSVEVAVKKVSGKPEIQDSSMALQFSEQNDEYVTDYHEKNFIADKTIAFILPGLTENMDAVLTETHNNETYFYANSRIEPQHENKKKPSSIGIFWDISSSGEKRDLQKEMDLLKQYLGRSGNVTFSLLPFNIYVKGNEGLRSNDINTLIEKLKSLNYDGGTQLGALDFSKYSFDEVLLFSDGLSTFGKEEIIFGNAPITTITTSPSANYSYLKYIALKSQGSFIDLGRIETSVALEQLAGTSLQVINITYNRSEIEDFVSQPTPILNKGFSFAGKLTVPSANVQVDLGFGNKVIATRTYTISKNEAGSYDQVKRIWAGMKINLLDIEYEKNKNEITRLGKEFSIVTQNTSLIVLDRVEDYVEHEIVPPAELQKEYYALLKEKNKEEEDTKALALSGALDKMKMLKEWWTKKFDVKKIIKPNPDPVPGDDSVRISQINLDGLSVSPDSTVVYVGAGAYSSSNLTFSTTVTTASPFLRLEEDVDRRSYGWTGTEGRYADSASFRSDIKLNEWKPDAPYLKALGQVAAKERFAKYLSLKKEFSNQPSFFVDVARFFAEKKEKGIGMQVLSNISEMKLEDASLLRIVANELMEAGETSLALETFRQILKMREEEPQSYRDLALAYNETGEYDKAIELLYKLITGTWSERFGDVKAIALNEMNAIISARNVSTAGIDPRFIYAMPVDVRIVIGWNADNSDVDLWITDPNEEKCSYQHTETMIGGRISRDVTQGYGPEEFLLKKALNGDYVIDANLFGDHRQTLGGPIAIKADLFTDFGKPTQKRKTINLRVTTNKEVVNLGSLNFGS